MKIWAIIQNNVVVNTILWDPVAQPDYVPAGQAIDITALVPMPSIGWSYDGGNFAPPLAEGGGA